MSYLVLARKWRPLTFADLVGQEHVALTLQNAIAQGRIAHAFLFTGARGVGKTTIARVLAKALNCMSASGPTASPCGKCSACEEIARSGDVDVKEIDGASNNSVDDVRRLQETLPYMPARDRFKVVIIDEVHMLSTGAFNALLKTLEEPPPHVKFIFATTEVHKVPITILSRCQRYDFKLLPTQKIRERLAFILGEEKIAFDDAAVALIAREAAGSMRDALSLLDQVIAGAGERGLVGGEASRLLGVADRAVLYDLARAVLRGDAPAALGLIATVAQQGYDLPTIARDFLALVRDLVVARVVPDPGELLDLADEERADVMAIAQGADPADLERLFAAWSRTADEVARAREPRWVLEMALVRLSHRPALVPVEELLNRLAEMERRLGGGGDSPRGPSPAGGGGSSSGSSGGSGGARGATAVPARPAGGGSVASAAGASGGAATSAVRVQTPVASAAASVPSERPRASAAPAVSQPQHVAAVIPLAPPAPAQPAWLARAQQHRGADGAPAAANTQGAPSTPPPAARPPAELLDTSAAAALLDAWERVLSAMEAGPVSILKYAVPLEVSPERVRIAYEAQSFYARKAAAPEVAQGVAEAAARVLGATPAVEVVQGALAEDAPTIVRREERARAVARAAKEQAAREHPLVKSFLALVGGEVRSVKLEGDPS